MKLVHGSKLRSCVCAVCCLCLPDKPLMFCTVFAVKADFINRHGSGQSLMKTYYPKFVHPQSYISDLEPSQASRPFLVPVLYSLTDQSSRA